MRTVAQPFQGLRWRIFVFVAGSLAAVLTVFFLVFTHFLERQLQREASAHAGVVANTLGRSLHAAMQGRDRAAILQILNDVAHNAELLEVVVADAAGTVTFASDEALAGRSLGDLVYGELPADRPWSILPGTAARPALIYRRTAVANEGQCRRCHDGGPVLATVGVALSYEPTAALGRLARGSFAGLVLLVLLLLFALNYVFFSRQVLAPLGGLLARFRDAAGGRLEAAAGPPPPGARDEIADLHRQFAEMLGELRRVHEVEVETERALVARQRDQRYQAELEEVNRQLSGRIGDLDLANERINRMALQLEERNRSLEEAVRNVSALNRVAVALSSELDIDRLVQLLITLSVKGLRVELGHIMFMDEERGELRMRAWYGLSGDFDPTLPVTPGESVSGTVAATSRPLLLRRVDGTGPIRPRSRYGFARRSCLCVPIRAKERLIGTIELTNKKGEEGFTLRDQEMLEAIAHQAAIAIDNASLYREVGRSYLDTVRALVQAVEEKDPYTRGHSERVTTFSMKIAQKFGLAPRRLQMLQYAGVLHDIGKIGIDGAILTKPERLTAEEFALVRQHPLIGERILRPIGFLAEALPAVSQHHERFDGFGYPQGIAGEALAIEARILAVADAYDAMITERPYRRPLPRRLAVAELRRCSGTQFDPVVVEQFLDILENDPEIVRLEERISSIVGT